MPEQPPVAIVTGGTRGIGLGVAAALAHDGWDLALSGVRAAREVEATVSSLTATGCRVHYVQSDMVQAGGLERRVRGGAVLRWLIGGGPFLSE